jgi:protein-ribulosamine 3-kinase
MLSDELLHAISARLGAGMPMKISPVSGGSINDAYKLQFKNSSCFVKTNETLPYPGMFQQEEKGLQLLKQAGEIQVPEVFAAGETGKESFILMEWIEGGKRQKKFFHDFGTRLAKLHKHAEDYFGLDHSNYMGSLQQHNNKHGDWSSFFIEERILPQLKIALDKSLLPANAAKIFETLFKRMPDIFPAENPSLLHGDLWSGNYITGPDGFAVIIDPAVYYGHREMDIAMTKLFGGFDNEFYTGYNETFPLEKGWESRMDICNLYPLLVHVNLFGAGYAGQVMEILRNFRA